MWGFYSTCSCFMCIHLICNMIVQLIISYLQVKLIVPLLSKTDKKQVLQFINVNKLTCLKFLVCDMVFFFNSYPFSENIKETTVYGDSRYIMQAPSL